MNFIAAYVIAHTINSFIKSSLYIHLGQHYDQVFGDACLSLVSGPPVLLMDFFIGTGI